MPSLPLINAQNAELQTSLFSHAHTHLDPRMLPGSDAILASVAELRPQEVVLVTEGFERLEGGKSGPGRDTIKQANAEVYTCTYHGWHDRFVVSSSHSLAACPASSRTCCCTSCQPNKAEHEKHYVDYV